MMKRFFAKAYIWILLVMLYAPMIIIGVFSFTEAKVLGNWTGFSTGLYRSLFTNGAHEALMSAALNTLIIGLVAATVATLLGTVSAIGIFNLRNKRFKAAMNTLNNVPILNADIITGVSLFLLFVSMGVTQGYVTLTLCHITFCTPYVVLSVMPRLKQMNPNTFEAALDLGATPSQALWKVIIPQIRSGMVSGFLLSFILSVDDFEVSVFNVGTNGLQTLSTYIYADSRKGGLTPELRPMITIMFAVILAVLIFMNLRAKKTNQSNSLK
ncbi:MAG: ABC transporter permease [Bacteroidales bacterium]|nr:ABC transporter permease [Bacteroidales bacterium]